MEKRRRAWGQSLTWNTVGAALLALGAGAALLVWPAPVTESVRASILYCLTGLAPSLFPFLALTSFVVRSGAGAVFGRGLGFLARYVFRLPACCAAPILLSWVGGYPAGARAASLLLGQGEITEGQAARMMLFCVNPGAAFVVTYLGGAVLHSVGAGWLLFTAVTLGSLLCGILAAWGSPIPPKNGPVSPGKVPKKPGSSPGGALVAAVSDASAAVLRMCACIVLFAGGSAVLRASGVTALLTGALAGTGLCSPGEAQALLAFLLEVTGGVGTATGYQAGAGLFAFGLAFGGLCVHLQVAALFARFPGPWGRFLLFRVIHGLTAAGLAALLGQVWPLPQGSQAVFAQARNTGLAFGGLSTTAAGGLSLVLLCAAFLLLAGKAGEKEDCAPGRDVV